MHRASSWTHFLQEPGSTRTYIKNQSTGAQCSLGAKVKTTMSISKVELIRRLKALIETGKTIEGDQAEWLYRELENLVGAQECIVCKAVGEECTSCRLERKPASVNPSLSKPSLNLVAMYADLMQFAHANNQTVGEKNDYYVTLQQLENAIGKVKH